MSEMIDYLSNTRHLFARIMFVMLGFCFAAHGQEQSIEMLNDMAIPLMAGLKENTEEAMLFDSPEGRVINAQANGNVDGAYLLKYYLMVLPSLGWNVTQSNEGGMRCADSAQYCMNAIREEENLTLNIETKSNVSEITYSLAPQ